MVRTGRRFRQSSGGLPTAVRARVNVNAWARVCAVTVCIVYSAGIDNIVAVLHARKACTRDAIVAPQLVALSLHITPSAIRAR
jgi:hypothetical protein